MMRFDQLRFLLVENTLQSSDDILLVWEIATGSVQKVVPNLDKPFYANNDNYTVSET